MQVVTDYFAESIFPEFSPSAAVLSAPSNAIRSGVGASDTPTTANAITTTAPCQSIPLSAFAHFDTTTEPLSITHQGQFPSITVSFNLAPNASLGSAIKTITTLQKDMNMPASLQSDFQGTAASFRNSLSNEPLLILAALVTVYIVLGVLYESFIHPITILSTLPSAGVGAFLALILFHQDLSIVAIIGLVLLIGIVEKNGIMMVDFALELQRQHGKEPHRGDLRGLPAAFPADHDDDDGGAAGRHSAGRRQRHGIGAAPAAGHCHGGRPAAQPGAHALYHAGDLHLLRSSWPSVCPCASEATDTGNEPQPAEGT